jgi:hypothetical protein
MIQIGAAQAQGSLLFHKSNPGSAAKRFSALRAGRISAGDENCQVFGMFHPFLEILPYLPADYKILQSYSVTYAIPRGTAFLALCARLLFLA